MHAFGKRLRQAVGQRLAQDRGIVVVGVLEALRDEIFDCVAKLATKPKRVS